MKKLISLGVCLCLLWNEAAFATLTPQAFPRPSGGIGKAAFADQALLLSPVFWLHSLTTRASISVKVKGWRNRRTLRRIDQASEIRAARYREWGRFLKKTWNFDFKKMLFVAVQWEEDPFAWLAAAYAYGLNDVDSHAVFSSLKLLKPDFFGRWRVALDQFAVDGFQEDLRERVILPFGHTDVARRLSIIEIKTILKNSGLDTDLLVLLLIMSQYDSSSSVRQLASRVLSEMTGPIRNPRATTMSENGALALWLKSVNLIGNSLDHPDLKLLRQLKALHRSFFEQTESLFERYAANHESTEVSDYLQSQLGLSPEQRIGSVRELTHMALIFGDDVDVRYILTVVSVVDRDSFVRAAAHQGLIKLESRFPSGNESTLERTSIISDRHSASPRSIFTPTDATTTEEQYLNAHLQRARAESSSSFLSKLWVRLKNRSTLPSFLFISMLALGTARLMFSQTATQPPALIAENGAHVLAQQQPDEVRDVYALLDDFVKTWKVHTWIDGPTLDIKNNEGTVSLFVNGQCVMSIHPTVADQQTDSASSYTISPAESKSEWTVYYAKANRILLSNGRRVFFFEKASGGGHIADELHSRELNAVRAAEKKSAAKTKASPRKHNRFSRSLSTGAKWLSSKINPTSNDEQESRPNAGNSDTHSMGFGLQSLAAAFFFFTRFRSSKRKPQDIIGKSGKSLSRFIPEMLESPRERTNVSSLTSIFDAKTHAEQFETRAQTTSFYFILAFFEEALFRLGTIHGAAILLISTGVSPMLAVISAAMFSAGVALLLPSVFRWTARAKKLGTSHHHADWWAGLAFEIKNEFELIGRTMWSASTATILFTLIYAPFALSNPWTAAIFILGFHSAWEYFGSLTSPPDPLDSQHVGQKRQMEALAVTKQGEFPQFWIAQADGDMLGKQNFAYNKYNLGLLRRPQDSNVLFYKKSPFVEMRSVLRMFFTQEGWDLHAGVGGDEIEPEIWGTRQVVEEKLDRIFQRYNTCFNNRYAFFSIDREDLTREEVERLRRLSGSITLTKDSGRFVLTVEVKKWGLPIRRTARALAAIQQAVGDKSSVKQIGRYTNVGPFTISLGAISISDVVGRLNLAREPTSKWMDEETGTIRADRVKEVYVWGLRMANRMLSEAKEEGRASYKLFGPHDGFHLFDLPAKRSEIEGLRNQIKNESAERPVAERDPVTGLLTSNQFSRDLKEKPRRFVYFFRASNWHGPSEITSRALHSVNEKLGYDAVTFAIKTLSEAVVGEVNEPEAYAARLPPDTIAFASDSDLVNRPGGIFSEAFINGLKPLLQEALSSGQDRSVDQKAFISDLNPVISVYVVDTSEVEGWKHQAPSSLRLPNIENPMQLAGTISLVEWTQELMPAVALETSSEIEGVNRLNLDELKEYLDVDSYANGRYYVKKFNPAKASKLLRAYEEARRPMIEKAIAALEEFYNTLSRRPAGWSSASRRFA